MKHSLHISRNLGGDLEGICETCYDVDYDGERFYATGGRYVSETESSVRDMFWDDHVLRFPDVADEEVATWFRGS